ncbi:MAG TPA: aminoglycoside phosphotransferase family protein [Methanomassiliicoccales archaeon]
MKIIAQGRHSTVYEYKDNQVLKMYPVGATRQTAEEELKKSMLVKEYGVECPTARDLFEEGGRYGILVDRVLGPNYLEWTLQHPTALNKLIALFVQEQHEIHMHKVPELPSIKDILWNKIRTCGEIQQGWKDRLQEKMRKLPEGEHLCHLDYHPENIVVSLDGPLTIDWANAGKGNYLADVAMTSVLFDIGTLPIGMAFDSEGLLENTMGRFLDNYIKEYLKMCGKGDEELLVWMAPVAAARLGEGIPEEREPLLRILKANI